jgi:hypothetical protein
LFRDKITDRIITAAMHSGYLDFRVPDT